MTLSVRCPKCKAVHRVGDEMAGQRAKCRCGAVLAIPAAQQAPSQPRVGAAPAAAQEESIVVRCPGCGKRHKAKASLAGTAVRCPCGTALKIPARQQSAASTPAQSTIWDELTEEQWAKIEGRKTKEELLREEEEAYAAETAMYSGGASAGLWRDGKKLVCANNAKFPPRCLKSNQPTDNRVEKTISYTPMWAIIVFGALIAMAFTRKIHIDYAVEPRWITRRMIHALSGVGVLLLGVLLMGIGMAVGEDSSAVAGVLILLGSLCTLAGILYASIGGRVFSVAYIDDRKEHAWLKGVHPDFLENLPVWDGPSH